MVPNRIVKKLILGSAQFGEKYGINNPGASVTKKEALKKYLISQNILA